MPTEPCNRVLVERYFLGEIPLEEKGPVLHHLDGCPDCRGLMAALENDKRTYLLEHPFREFAAKRLGEGKAGPSRAMDARWLLGLAGVAACLVLLPVVFRSQHAATALVGEGAPAAVPDQGIRTKGGTVLEYYLKRGDLVAPGSAAEPYRAGDELQFVYAAGGHAFVSLASIDSRGHVSLYKADAGAAHANGTDANPGAGANAGQPSPVPPKAPLSQAALPGERQALPFAVTLDDAPGAELFVMIYGSGPLEDTAVESWLTEAFTRASGNLEGLTPVLSPPPVSAPGDPAAPAAPAARASAGKSDVKTLLIRKTRA